MTPKAYIEMTPIEEARARAEFRDRQQAIAKARDGWGLPMRYAVTHPEPKGPWGDKYREMALRLRTGFLSCLSGGRGVGKTQMAAELMKVATVQASPARYTTATRFFMAIKATYKQDQTRTESSVIDEFRKPSLLVIDEIGKRSESEWENNLLFELLNSRYGDMTDTLLIDNRTPAEIEKAIGDSIISRMIETGGIIKCDWPSFRK